MEKPLLYRYKRTNVTDTPLSSVISALNAGMDGFEEQQPTERRFKGKRKQT